jgi:hypothetical protein
MQEVRPIRALVVDVHTVLRQRLCSLQTPNYVIEVAGEGGRGHLL